MVRAAAIGPSVTINQEQVQETKSPNSSKLRQIAQPSSARAQTSINLAPKKLLNIDGIANSGGLREVTGYKQSLSSWVSNKISQAINTLKGQEATSSITDRNGLATFRGLERLSSEALNTAIFQNDGVEQKTAHRDAVVAFRDAFQQYVDSKPGKLSNDNAILAALDKSIAQLDVEVSRQKAGLSSDAIGRVGVCPSSGGLTPLDSGLVSSVSTGAFHGFEGTAVFKAETDVMLYEVPGNMFLGIPVNAPNLVGRSVASSVINDELKLGLVGKTRFATHEGQHGFITELAVGKQMIGPKAERPGVSQEHNNLRKAIAFDLTAPQLASRLTDLQLFDELTGQIDRHPGNAFIHKDKDKGTYSVTAIDNDQSFGSINGSADGETGLHCKRSKLPKEMPPVVPKATADKFLALDEQTLRKNLDGLLSAEETNAAVERLKNIHAHLEKIGPENHLDEAEWNQQDFGKLLNSNNSYVGTFAWVIKDGYNNEKIFNIPLVFDADGNHLAENPAPELTDQNN